MAIILDGVLSEKALRAAAGDDLYERGEGHVEAVCVHSLAVGGEALCDVHLFWHDDVITGVCTCPRFSDRGFCEHMVAVGLAVLDDVRDGAVVPAPPSGAFAASPAPADSGPAPRGGRARTATPDPGAVKDIGAELLRSARSLTVVRRFLRPGEAARYARSIERFLDGLESFPADRGGPDGAAPALLHIATRLRAQLETRIDDSGGRVTRTCQRAIDLYARACREGRPNGAGARPLARGVPARLTRLARRRPERLPPRPRGQGAGGLPPRRRRRRGAGGGAGRPPRFRAEIHAP